MPFITKGKTNIKYLAIVAVLAILAGTGIFLLRQNKDKLNYQPAVSTSTSGQTGGSINQPVWKWSEKKSIDGRNYYIAVDTLDNKIYLYRENSDLSKEKVWSDNLQINIHDNLDFYYDELSEVLFVIDGGDSVTQRILSYTEGLTSNPKEIFKKTEGDPSDHDCYAVYIEKVYPDVGKILINSHLAYGCEGNPSLPYKFSLVNIDGSGEKIVQKFLRDGNSLDNFTRYIGTKNDHLFFGDYKYIKTSDIANPNYGGRGELLRVFELDPISMDKKIILDESAISGLAPITDVKFLEGNNNILQLKSNQDIIVEDKNGIPSVIKGEQKEYEFDLTKKSLIK